MVVWPSWPQACILPAVVEACGTPLVSSIGSASMSARRPIAPLPLPARSTPTTPVLAIPVWISSTPKAFSLSATIAEVRCSSKPSSG